MMGGRDASISSARGCARARMDWYLKAWTRLPRSSVRSPMIKVGGRGSRAGLWLQCGQMPVGFSCLQTGHRFLRVLKM